MNLKESGLIPSDWQFSWSQFNQYDTCPRDFKVKYLDKIWGPSNPFGLLGCGLHELLRNIYEEKNFIPRYAYSTWENVLQKEYKTDWKQYQYGHITSQEVEGMKFYGFKLLKQFFALAEREEILKPVPFNELAIKCGYKNHKLKVVIDTAMDTRYGFAIVDWKTGAPKEIDVYQAVLYAAVYEKKCNKKVDLVAIVYIKTGEIKYHMLTPELRAKARKYISDIYTRIITDKEFKPKEHKYCETCNTRAVKGCQLFGGVK